MTPCFITAHPETWPPRPWPWALGSQEAAQAGGRWANASQSGVLGVHDYVKTPASKILSSKYASLCTSVLLKLYYSPQCWFPYQSPAEKISILGIVGKYGLTMVTSCRLPDTCHAPPPVV